LNVVPIQVPPLRERLTDIPLLVDDFLKEYSKKGLGRKIFSPEALAVMMQHDWPGNVRELRNFIERVVIMCSGEVVPGEIVENLLGRRRIASRPESPLLDMSRFRQMTYKDAKRAFEKEFLKQRLLENEGNISQTAEQIGIERSHLHKKVKSLAIEE
jgi:two-component system nitrogen regulation response regulator NtrX